MNQNQISYRTSSEQLKHQSLRTGNSLKLKRTKSIWDRKKLQLIYLLETNQMVSGEISATLKDNRLILEVPLLSSYDRPFRTHLIGKEIREEVEDGFMSIGFSEYKLRPGYHYSLISCQAINSKMIKVILGYTLWGKYRNN